MDKNNVPTIEKVAPNDLAIERLKEEKKMRGTVSAFSAGTLDYVLPRYVDNSLLKYFPPIGDQGALGSCAAFNTTYYQFTYTIAKANGWDVKNDSDNTKSFLQNGPLILQIQDETLVFPFLILIGCLWIQGRLSGVILNT